MKNREIQFSCSSVGRWPSFVSGKHACITENADTIKRTDVCLSFLLFYLFIFYRSPVYTLCNEIIPDQAILKTVCHQSHAAETDSFLNRAVWKPASWLLSLRWNFFDCSFRHSPSHRSVRWFGHHRRIAVWRVRRFRTVKMFCLTSPEAYSRKALADSCDF